MKYWLAIFFLVISAVLQGQNDTIWDYIQQERDFELRKKVILDKGGRLLYSNPDLLPELSALAARLAKKHHDAELRAESHTTMALYYRNKGVLDSALIRYESALQILKNLPPSFQRAKAYNLMSIAIRDFGDDESFLAYNDSAISMAEQVNESDFKLLLLNNRAYILSKLGKKEAAFELMNEINESLKGSADYGFRSSVALNLAFLFREKEMPDSAMSFTQRAIHFAEQAGENRSLASAHTNLAELQMENDQHDDAQQSLEYALKLYKELNDALGTLNANVRLARVQFKLGNRQRSFELLDSVIGAATEIRLMETLSMALRQSYQLHEEIGDFEQALQHHKKLHNLLDSLNTAETQEHIAKLEAQFQFREQQRKLEILERDRAIEKQKTYILYGLIAALILLSAMTLVVLLIRFRSRQKIALKEKARLKLELEKRELKEEKLNSELTLKNKQLTTRALLLSERNELLGQLMKKLNDYTGSTGAVREKLIVEMKTELKLHLNDGADWKEFRTYFEETNPEFLEKVDQLKVDLSEKDKRLLALSRLGLNTKEIALLMHIAPDSVKMSRYRLKKKLNLSEEESIWDFVNRQ